MSRHDPQPNKMMRWRLPARTISSRAQGASRLLKQRVHPSPRLLLVVEISSSVLASSSMKHGLAASTIDVERLQLATVSPRCLLSRFGRRSITLRWWVACIVLHFNCVITDNIIGDGSSWEFQDLHTLHLIFGRESLASLSDLNLDIPSLVRILPTEPAFLSRHASIPVK